MTITPGLAVMSFLALIGIIGVSIISTKKGRDWLDRVLKKGFPK